MNMKHKVSVIIPVYNSSKFLKRCLDSLMQQTLKDIEYIFINDASTDDSLAILRDYESKYTNRAIIIIDLKKNEGIANARNIGITYANGEYVTHCDSDDWIETETYESLYNSAKSRNADIASCNFIYEYPNYQHIVRQPYASEKEECIKKLLNGAIFPSLWASIIKRELIVKYHLHFPKGLNMGEDLFFNIQAYYYSSTIISTDKAFYHYCHYQDSVCVQRSRASINSDIKIAGLIEQFFKERNESRTYQKEIAYRKFYSKLSLIKNFNDKAAYHDWLCTYQETHPYIMSFEQIEIKLRAMLWLAAHHQFYVGKCMRFILILQNRIKNAILLKSL